MKRLNLITLPLAFLALSIVASAAQALTVNIDTPTGTRDRGFIGPSACDGLFFCTTTPATEGTYWARALSGDPDNFGQPGPAIEIARLYHIFDLSSITPGTITGATLKIPHGSRSYTSTTPTGPGDPTESLSLFDVSSSTSDLRSNSLSPAMTDAIFNDLGTGTEFGSFVATEASNNTIEEIILNAAAIASLNAAAGGEWAIGGALTSFADGSTAFGAEQQIFKGSEDADVFNIASQLELTIVPIPAAAPLLMSGLGWLWLIAARKRRRELS
ncbi:MAG: VPLPA-CTERM sorting domain-containing protein [Pseudomonadota bacterium]